MELYRKVRLACRDGMSERAAARHFGVSRQSVRKMLEFSVPPGYRRTAPVRRPKLDEFTALIEQWLEDDRRHGYPTRRLRSVPRENVACPRPRQPRRGPRPHPRPPSQCSSCHPPRVRITAHVKRRATGTVSTTCPIFSPAGYHRVFLTFTIGSFAFFQALMPPRYQ